MHLPAHVIVNVRRLRSLATLALVLMPALFLLYWLSPQSLGFVAPTVPGGVAWGSLSAGQQWMARLLSLIPLAVAAWAVWRLRTLLDCYARGEIFSLAAIGHVASVGKAWLVWVGVNMVLEPITSVLMTWHLPQGERMLAVRLDSDALIAALLGSTLWVMSWVMKAGRRAVRENEQFI